MGQQVEKLNVNERNIDSGIESILSTLKKHGVLALTNFCDQEKTKLLCNEYLQLINHESNSWLEKRPYSMGAAVLVTRNSDFKIHFPATYNFFDSKFMRSITSNYLGKEYTSNNKIFVVKDVVGSKHNANDLHFDVERTLKFFLYLTDTTEKNGAFKCVPGSHKYTNQIRKENPDKISYENREFSRQLPFGPEDAISIDGKAGTLIIFDTDVFHQAGTVSEGERWVIRGQTEAVGKLDKKLSLFRKIISKIKR